MTSPSWFRSGVGNLQHACHNWHAKQFPMACRSSTFYMSIFYVSQVVSLTLTWYNNMDVVGTLDDLEP